MSPTNTEDFPPPISMGEQEVMKDTT